MSGREEPEHDQDAEPSLNAPEEGRPDGVLPEDSSDDHVEERGDES
ncbi:hypothetical protein [Nocardioides sp. LHG3406-4]